VSTSKGFIGAETRGLSGVYAVVWGNTFMLILYLSDLNQWQNTLQSKMVRGERQMKNRLQHIKEYIRTKGKRKKESGVQKYIKDKAKAVRKALRR
jgi:hypothetical protein